MTISKTAWHTFRRECRFYRGHKGAEGACILLSPFDDPKARQIIKTMPVGMKVGELPERERFRVKTYLQVREESLNKDFGGYVKCELCYDFCPLLLAMEEFFNNA